jgi:hypothetical protein
MNKNSLYSSMGHTWEFNWHETLPVAKGVGTSRLLGPFRWVARESVAGEPN